LLSGSPCKREPTRVQGASGGILQPRLAAELRGTPRTAGFLTNFDRRKFLATSAAGVAAPRMVRAADQPVRVQLTTGGHPYGLSFDSIFEGRDDLAVTVNPHPSAYRSDLRKRADVLLLYDLAEVSDERERGNLRNFVEAGKGVVVIHHAIADNQKWPWWCEEVVGGLYLLAPDRGLPASKVKIPVDLTIRPAGKHPITEEMEPFRLVAEEAYKGMWISPKVRVLLETDHPDNDKPVAWIGPHPTSRVVYVQPGHGRDTHQNANYRRLVHRAILWAAGRLD